MWHLNHIYYLIVSVGHESRCGIVGSSGSVSQEAASKILARAVVISGLKWGRTHSETHSGSCCWASGLHRLLLKNISSLSRGLFIGLVVA